MSRNASDTPAETLEGEWPESLEPWTELPGFIAATLLTCAAQLVLETALERELVRHLGYDRYSPAGRNRLNSRNGTRPKSVLTDVGSVRIRVPRDRYGTFEPMIVRKRQQRRLGLGWVVVGVLAGEPTAEIARRLGAVYHRALGREAILDVAKAVVGEFASLPWETNGPGSWVTLHLGTTVLPTQSACPVAISAVIGGRADGSLTLLALRRGEVGAIPDFWPSLLRDLTERQVVGPSLVLCDDEAVLRAAATVAWPAAALISAAGGH